ncbi:MAG: hypothetical protein EAZ85_13950 [Bacteroidetes bacterium]|nr:MAG: hypothetical protein EAZ85_13950 [Bacteroidota bacterium]TAG88022.1 MAG: hypothetical protein EAZ20_09430 [Bacteroidota bacterium]
MKKYHFFLSKYYNKFGNYVFFLQISNFYLVLFFDEFMISSNINRIANDCFFMIRIFFTYFKLAVLFLNFI